MTNPQPPGPYGQPAGVDGQGRWQDVTIPQQQGMPTGPWAAPAGAPPQGYGAGGYPGGPAPQGYGPGPTAPYGAYGAPPPGYGPPPTAQLAGQGGVPPWGFWAPPPPPPRRRGPIIAAVVLVVALVAGGVVAYTTLFSRGADSPTEAVELLAAAIGDGDMVAALRRLHPAEVDLITDTNDVITPELERLGILKPGASMTQNGSFTATNLQFDPNPEMVVPNKVAILKLTSGTITITQDPASVPFTDGFRDKVFPGGLPAGAQTTTIDVADIAGRQGGLRVATVNSGGAWYVSVLYTIADYALLDAGKSWPQQAVTPRGGTDAQDALRQTVQAALDQDGRRLIELAPPGELSVLHDVGNAIPAPTRTATSTFKIVDLQTTATTVDGQTALGIEKVVLQNGRGQGGSITRSGSCVLLEETGGRSQSQKFCPDDILRSGFGASASLSPEATRAVTAVMTALLDVKIVVVEAEGGWYVSPTRTTVALYASVLRALQPGDIEALIDAGR